MKRDRFSVTTTNILAVTTPGREYFAADIQQLLRDYRPTTTSGFKPRAYGHKFQPSAVYIGYVLRRNPDHFIKKQHRSSRHTWTRISKEASE